MKSFLVVFVALLCSQSGFAQIEKGRGFLSGSFALGLAQSHGSYFDGSVTSVGAGSSVNEFVSVDRGKFYKDGWLFGYRIGLSSYRQKNQTTSTYNYGGYDNQSNLTASAYIRRYWRADILNIYVGGGISASYGYTNSSSDGYLNMYSMERSRNFSVAPIVHAGALYPITNRLALDVQAEYGGLPIPLSTFKVGLVKLTGKGTGQTSESTYETTATQAGNWFISGGISYGNSTTQKSQSVNIPKDTTLSGSNIYFNPSIGLFVYKNLLVGVGLSYSSGRAFYSPRTASLSITPYIRKYIGNRQLRPYVQANYYIPSISLPKDTTGQISKSRNLNASLGLAYILGDHFIIDANLITIGANYSWGSYKDGSNYSSWIWSGVWHDESRYQSELYTKR